MPSDGVQEIVLERFTRGWHPRNRPPEHLYPRELEEGQVLDAMGLRATPGGQLRWHRNQFKIHHPDEDDSDVQIVKSLVEFRTDDSNQMLAFVLFNDGGDDEGQVYVLETDWPNVGVASQWEYGYELFSGETWAKLANNATAIATVPTWGIADAAQAKEVLFITYYAAVGQSPHRYDGTDLEIIGLDAPATPGGDPSAAEAADAASKLTTGTYSYFYTYDDGEFESMPSALVDVEVTAEGKKVQLTGLDNAAAGTPAKNIYRAYTTETGAGVRVGFFGLPRYEREGDRTGGVTRAGFRFVAQIAHGTLTYDDLLADYELGEELWFDRASPPLGTLCEWHKDRMFMAGCVKGSPSYSGYNSGYWGNVLLWSELDEPYYWPGENMLIVGDDTEITGIVSWRDHLVILKENSIWVLTGYDQEDLVLEQVAAHVGSVADNAQAAGPEGVLWAAPDGYYFYNGGEPRRILQSSPFSPWGQHATAAVIPTIAYHSKRFYILQLGYWLEWEPTEDQWSYFKCELKDAAGYQVGFRSYDFGEAQSHLLTRMAWEVDGDQEITVLNSTGDIANGDAMGTEESDLHAPVKLTLPHIEAPLGSELVPLEVIVDGSWEEGEPGPPADSLDAWFTCDDRAGNAPHTVVFEDLSEGEPTSWLWDFGGEEGTSELQDPTHEYTEEGEYTVTLTVYKGDAEDTCVRTDYIVVGGSPPTPPVAEFSIWPTWQAEVIGAPMSSGPAPHLTRFKDLSSPAADHWYWQFGDDETSYEQHPWHEYNAEGEYTVTLTASNAGGQDVEEKVAYITITEEGPWLVSGAGDSDFNGTYVIKGRVNGRNYYRDKGNRPYWLFWDGYAESHWGLAYGSVYDQPDYASQDDQVLGAVGVWQDWLVGGAPAPGPTVVHTAGSVLLFLNQDADYSEAIGDNAWAGTPEAPQNSNLIGVPSGYEYDSTIKGNVAKRWYVQFQSNCAPSFILNRVVVRYALRAARGEAT